MSDTVLIPPEFLKVIRDLVKDLKHTFPEFISVINGWWHYDTCFSQTNEDEHSLKNANQMFEKLTLQPLFSFCSSKMPPRFLDVIYQNEDIFKEDSDIDTEFLPGIDFKIIWNDKTVSSTTKDTIWKYLQLITYSIVGTMDTISQFGDTAKLFEALNKDELSSKLHETIEQMKTMFENINSNENSDGTDMSFNIPNSEKINEHIAGLMEGKIGKFAQEIASEISEEYDDATTTKDVFEKLLKKPNELMKLVKKVGTKLDSKIKSGEITESEMMEEATKMMGDLKNIPGMPSMQSMLNQMGLGGLGKMNTKATEAQMAQRLKLEKTRERIRAKVKAKEDAKIASQSVAKQNTQPSQIGLTDEELITLFETPKNLAEKSLRKSKRK